MGPRAFWLYIAMLCVGIILPWVLLSTNVHWTVFVYVTGEAAMANVW
jgi:hypothetical protein